MARIKLETTQNVLLEFDLAGAGDRIISGILDWLFIGAYFFFFYFLFLKLSISGDTQTFLFIVLVTTPIFFYHILFQIFMNGQSPGKKIMKIKVIKLDGAQPSLGDYILRWVFRIIDWLPFLFITAIISIVVSKKEQCIGDVVANTTVIKLKKRASLEDTILKVIEHNYKPTFKDVLLFSDKDINTIKEALEIYKKNKNSKHIDKLALKAKQLLKEEANTMSSYRTLDTILKDYNFFNYEA